MRTTRAITDERSTRCASGSMPLSRRVRRSRFSVMRARRSDSCSISPTNSRTVCASMFSVCKMESDRSLIPASGVLSSWLASDTKRRRASSVVCNRSAISLNSAASSLISSCPPTSARWLYEPSRILRMASVSTPKRRVSTRDKSTLIPPANTSTTAEIVRRLRCRDSSSSACSVSYS